MSLDENDEFDKAELDEGGVEKTGNDSRTAPTYCNQLDDQAVIMPDYDEGGADTIKKLIGFVQFFASLTSVENKNIKCVLCALDPTVSQKMKDKRRGFFRPSGSRQHTSRLNTALATHSSCVPL